jgi:phosphate transport system substrate-binding protein
MFSKKVSQEEIDKGCWRIGTVIDAVVPTVNANNPYIDIIKERGLTCEKFTAIFIDGSVTTWEQALNIKKPGVTPINVYTRSDACGAADTWAAYLGKKKQENLKGTGVNADPGLADAVAKDIYGIGFNNTIYAYDIKTGNKRENLEVIPIDINANGKIDLVEAVYGSFTTILKAIKDGVYPSPPARELNIVSKGKPQKECVVEFLKWCLTDGQKFVTEAGYVQLPQEKLDEYLKSLE